MTSPVVTVGRDGETSHHEVGATAIVGLVETFCPQGEAEEGGRPQHTGLLCSYSGESALSESFVESPAKKQKQRSEEATGKLEEDEGPSQPGPSANTQASSTTYGDLSHKGHQPVGGSDRNLRSEWENFEDKITAIDSQTRKKREIFTLGQSVTCPICRLSLRSSDVHSHVDLEMEKLKKIGRGSRKSTNSPMAGTKVLASTSSDMTGEALALNLSHSPLQRTRYKTYLRIKRSREQRLLARKTRKCPGDDEVTCPVCSQVIVGTQEELTTHVDICLKQEEDAEMEEVDVEGDGDSAEEYEEYTWAGQTRIRVTSLLPGGLAGSGFQKSSKVEDEDEDLDLNVDEDDTDIYGRQQYSEADIIPCTSEEPAEEKERKALRKAMLEGHSNSETVPPERSRWTEPQSVTENMATSDTFGGEISHGTARCLSPATNHDRNSSDSCSDTNAACSEVSTTIAILKAKVKEQAAQLGQLEKPKCLICMEGYSKPAVSIQCWHVHCEECWLRTLGVKKLCPQCNTITSAADLRRIFL